MRSISLNFRRALYAQESGEVPVFLLTITHPSLSDPILLSTDPTARITTDPLVYGTISRSNTYLWAASSLQLPDDQGGSAPAAKLTIENVTRGLIPMARSINSPAQIKIEAVLASAPDTVEISWPQFDMTNLQYGLPTLQFDLTLDALTAEPFPSGTMSPGAFPSLFF